jgi:hypothetical protein
MAQDFYSAFHLNGDSLHITSIDEDGVALAGIQALNKKLEKENTELKAQIADLTKAQTSTNTKQADDEKEIAELKQMIQNMSQAQASIKQ